MEEYKAEVGPLQREMGVISQAKTAAARIQQKANSDATAAKLKAAQIMINDGLATAKIAQTLALTPQEMEKVELMRAQIGKLNAETEFIGEKTIENNLTNNALRSTGGFELRDPKVSSAAGVGFLSRENPEHASTLVDTMKAFQSAQTNVGSGEKQTVRVPYKRAVTGWDRTGRSHITWFDDEKVYRENVPKVNTSLSTYPWEKPKVAPLPPATPPQAVSPSDSPGEVTIRTTNGKEYVSKPNPSAPRFSRGKWIKPIHESQVYRLSNLMDIPKEKFNQWESDRYPDAIGPPGVKAPSDESKAGTAYETSLRDLSRSASEAFINNELSNIGGVVDNFLNNMKSYSGDIPPDAINIRQLSVDTMMNRLLAMSGKALTKYEIDTHMKSLPNIAADHPAVVVFKAMQLKHMMDIRQIFDELRLGNKDIDNFYQTRSGSALAAMPKVTFDKMEQLRQLMSGSISSMKIGNKVFTDPKAAKAEIQAGFSRTSLNKLIKSALKEANITDAIPLN
jgi:hypothetical protein